MRALLKVLLFFAVSAIAARISGFIVSSQLDEGSEVSDEVCRVVILNGLEFTSRARGLRSMDVSVALGGAKLDLRGALVDTSGARVLARNTLGGLLIVVPEDWAVSVADQLLGGGNTEIDVTPLDELPDDAPKLHIDVTTRFAGTVISTKDRGF